ncbi:MAG: flippase-like domain-containing protein [bacterium]|nr:flippase-like domain-containing protein [bacterium]
MDNKNTFSLKTELLKKRSLFSFALSCLLIAFFFSRTSWVEIVSYIEQADPLLLLSAFLAHYVSYIFRATRWKRMLRPVGFSGNTLDLAKITFLFESVDCVLPAKLGDLYGAHLMRINFDLSRSFALGSIFLWRIFDMIVVAAFAGLSAFMLFKESIPPDLLSAIIVIAPLLALGLLCLGLFVYFHKAISARFKSEKLKKLLGLFQQGLRLELNAIPYVLLTTILLWTVEILRFYLVCKAMGVNIHPLAATFVTLFAMLFTAFPLTPSGLGAVELAMVKLLAFVGVTGQFIYPLIIWDRIIAHWSQIVLGLLFVIFSKPIKLKVWHTESEQNAPSEQSLVHS